MWSHTEEVIKQKMNLGLGVRSHVGGAARIIARAPCTIEIPSTHAHRGNPLILELRAPYELMTHNNHWLERSKTKCGDFAEATAFEGYGVKWEQSIAYSDRVLRSCSGPFRRTSLLTVSKRLRLGYTQCTAQLNAGKRVSFPVWVVPWSLP